MSFSFRAAIIAATTLTFAAGIGATAPGVAGEAEKTPVQAINEAATEQVPERKSTRLNSSHVLYS